MLRFAALPATAIERSSKRRVGCTQVRSKNRAIVEDNTDDEAEAKAKANNHVCVVSLDLHGNEDDELEVAGIVTCAVVGRDAAVLYEKRQLFKAGPDDIAQWYKFVSRADVASYLDQDTLRIRCTICAFDLNEGSSLVSLSRGLGQLADTSRNRCVEFVFVAMDCFFAILPLTKCHNKEQRRHAAGGRHGNSRASQHLERALSLLPSHVRTQDERNARGCGAIRGR